MIWSSSCPEERVSCQAPSYLSALCSVLCILYSVHQTLRTPSCFSGVPCSLLVQLLFTQFPLLKPDVTYSRHSFAFSHFSSFPRSKLGCHFFCVVSPDCPSQSRQVTLLCPPSTPCILIRRLNEPYSKHSVIVFFF